MAKKKQVQLEYTVNSSVGVLYNCLSTPSGLAEWFADNVVVNKEVYTFIWERSQENAVLVTRRANEFIRFRWEGSPKEYYFEFRIKIDELTGDVALIVTDFVEDDEEDESRLLWDSQINQLLHIIGS